MDGEKKRAREQARKELNRKGAAEERHKSLPEPEGL